MHNGPQGGSRRNGTVLSRNILVEGWNDGEDPGRPDTAPTNTSRAAEDLES